MSCLLLLVNLAPCPRIYNVQNPVHEFEFAAGNVIDVMSAQETSNGEPNFMVLADGGDTMYIKGYDSYNMPGSPAQEFDTTWAVNADPYDITKIVGMESVVGSSGS
jgi:hypothetical protein